ncbi:MAG: UDP-N-acetylmuramate--L-alanine ligase [Lawsonibacter sp.]|nr:UDP-N-acetylmuramate--L-alanine ligase [Lawsonibacter sp.]
MDWNIQEYICPGRRAHLVGIGGVSMSPLAEVLFGAGVAVTGSDMQDSPAADHLRALGIPVTVGHRPESVEGADCVIRTAAVHDENPEIAAAHALGIPVFERAQAWGAIMSHYKNALCIAGTHGKTTTTAMCTHILLAAGRDPSVMLGGTLPILGAGHRVGKGDTFVAESCEYCNSFLSFRPTVAVILNVEADHLDFFKDLEDIKASFRRFARLTPSTGSVIVNADNAGARSVAQGLDPFTFGLEEGAECTAGNLQLDRGRPSFDILVHGEVYARARLQVYGRHNVSNALAAAAAAYVLGVPGQAVEEGLAAFPGAGRRFERKGSFRGADVYDDYAHHPDELCALLSTARTLGYGRVVCAFQPHTYSRTHELFDGFVQALRLADAVVLAEIYAAREQNTLGISSRDLAERISGAVFCPTLEETAACLAEIARPGDLILTVGAGDIYKAGEALLARPQGKG